MILDLTRTGKPNDIRDYIVFENLRVQSGFRPYENEKRAFSNSSDLKPSVLEKSRFHKPGVNVDVSKSLRRCVDLASSSRARNPTKYAGLSEVKNFLPNQQ